MTQFMEESADMLVFRVITSDDPSQTTLTSRMKSKAVFLSPNGDMVEYRN